MAIPLTTVHRPGVATAQSSLADLSWAIGLPVVAAGFVVTPLVTILFRAYRWHIAQPAFIEGGLELLGLSALMALLTWAIPIAGVRAVLVGALAALYLQRHSMLVSALAAWLYLETLVQAGRSIQRYARHHAGNDTLVNLGEAFVIGVVVWSAAALLLSALGFGTFLYLRALTLVILLLALLPRGFTPVALTLGRRFSSAGRSEQMLALGLLILLLTECGKAAVSVDYDSGWYGFRPEQVLVGERSFFDSLHLVHFVYYYPKLFELLMAPLSGLGEYTFIQAGNIAILAMSLLLLFEILRLVMPERWQALLWTFVAATIPGFANMASTAKTDTLATCLGLASVLFLLRATRSRSLVDVSLALSACALQLATKISAFIYVPPIVVGGAVALWVSRGSATGAGTPPPAARGLPSNRGFAWGLFGTACAVACGFALRTYVITGSPTLPVLKDFWDSIGLRAAYPWSLLRTDLADWTPPGLGTQLAYWLRLFFNPSQYIHYVMAWPSNLAAFLALSASIALATGLVPRCRHLVLASLVAPASLAGLSLSWLVERHAHGGSDGNYFLLPVMLTVVGCCGLLANLGGRARAVLTACGLAFVAMHLPILLASHWSWSYGTRAFDWDFSRTYVNAEAESVALLGRGGALEIEEHLRARPGPALCVGYSRDGETTEAVLRRLSCRFEDFEQVQGSYPELLDDVAAVERYLAWSHAGLLIVPAAYLSDPANAAAPVRLTFESLVGAPGVVRVDAKRYVALDLRGADGRAAK